MRRLLARQTHRPTPTPSRLPPVQPMTSHKSALRKWRIHLHGPRDSLGGFMLRLHINTPWGHLVMGTPVQVKDPDGQYRDRWSRVSWERHDT